jgi:hypothetical protein
VREKRAINVVSAAANSEIVIDTASIRSTRAISKSWMRSQCPKSISPRTRSPATPANAATTSRLAIVEIASPVAMMR